MITVDINKCKKCNICINRFKGYCITEKQGIPVFDHSICNLCQKCVAICPHQAILVNNIVPYKIKKAINLKSEDLLELLKRRRSIKLFREKQIPDKLIKDIVNAAKYAPNQNKNIDAIIINDKKLIEYIDSKALSFYLKIYRLLFSFKPLTMLIKLIFADLDAIKKKFVHDIYIAKHIVKPNTQVLILLIGNKKVPITKGSAQYLFANMIIYAHSLGIGSCLLDSLKIAINASSKTKRKLNIRKKLSILGVLCLGYSAENIVNIPRGYELNIQWNTGTTNV